MRSKRKTRKKTYRRKTRKMSSRISRKTRRKTRKMSSRISRKIKRQKGGSSIGKKNRGKNPLRVSTNTLELGGARGPRPRSSSVSLGGRNKYTSKITLGVLKQNGRDVDKAFFKLDKLYEAEVDPDDTLSQGEHNELAFENFIIRHLDLTQLQSASQAPDSYAIIDAIRYEDSKTLQGEYIATPVEIKYTSNYDDLQKLIIHTHQGQIDCLAENGMREYSKTLWVPSTTTGSGKPSKEGVFLIGGFVYESGILENVVWTVIPHSMFKDVFS